MTVLEVQDLSISIETEEREIAIVKNVSFEIKAGETRALVGESGCGKTMTACAIVRLFRTPNVKITSGTMYFCGENLLVKSEKEMRKIRGKEISFISQNPLNSLNPTLQVGTQLMESIKLDRIKSKKEAKELAIEMLHLVGFSDCKERLSSYPHELSGGMRQRLLIAMALINSPKLVIADEPTTALDVTIQARNLDLLSELQEKFGTSILFITHDIGVVARIATNVSVMYDGRIIEQGPVEKIFYHPEQHYTRELLCCS